MIVAVAALCAPGQAAAQESEIVIVTGSRLERDLVSASDLRLDAMMPGVADPIRALTAAAGVSVSAPPGGVSEVFVRGADPNFTVVLIDGVRVNDPTNTRGGGYDFSTLSSDEIARVQIVRGALSAVHGSDAMAGIISVETWDDPDVAARVRVQAGERSYGRAYLGASALFANGGRLGFSAALHDLGDLGEGARQELSTAAVRGELNSWSGGVRYAERTRSGFPDASGGPLFAVNRALEHAASEDLLAWSRLRHDTDAGAVDVSLSYFGRSEIIATPLVEDGVFSGAPASTSDTDFARWAGTLALRGEVSATRYSVGGALEHEHGERRGEIVFGPFALPSNFDLTREGAAIFAEAETALTERFSTHGALRVDARDGDRARVSGRAEARYREGPLSVAASWASGHKAPSLYALGDGLVGNPDLRVESVSTTEVSVAWRQPRWRVQVGAFASDYADLIDFDFATFRLVNRADVRISGVEAEAELALGAQASLRIFAVASDTDVAADAALLNRPNTYGGAHYRWRGADWSAELGATLVGERRSASTPTGARSLDAYARVDAGLARRFGEHASLFLAADNLTDAEIEEAAGFVSAGRTLRIGVTLTRAAQ